MRIRDGDFRYAHQPRRRVRIAKVMHWLLAVQPYLHGGAQQAGRADGDHGVALGIKSQGGTLT